MQVRTQISRYLRDTGVLLDPPDPRAWFYWLEPRAYPAWFLARCCDRADIDDDRDDGWQPWDYVVLARVTHREDQFWRAEGEKFLHRKDDRLKSYPTGPP